MKIGVLCLHTHKQIMFSELISKLRSLSFITAGIVSINTHWATDHVHLAIARLDPFLPSQLLQFYMAQIQRGPGNISQRF